MSRRRPAILGSRRGCPRSVVGDGRSTGLVQRELVLRGALVWNLLLAWIPFALAIYVDDGRRRGGRGPLLWGRGGALAVFFPNAPYIVTDFSGRRWVPRWTSARPDLVRRRPRGGGRWCGLMLGFISLYLMQAVVPVGRRLKAWAFVIGVLAVSSFGIYLGRFQRWEVVGTFFTSARMRRDNASGRTSHTRTTIRRPWR